jgi:hypothetical protein
MSINQGTAKRVPYSPTDDGASVANIVATFTRGTADDYATGRQWYRTARDIATGVGHGDSTVGAGILAALSPQLGWPVNVALAQRCSRTRRFSAGHFKACLGKARRIHRGEAVGEVLRGPKESAFACNIANGEACSHDAPCVTIDRHAIAIALGRQITDSERNKFGRGTRYAAIAQLYRDASSLLGIAPHVLQACTWITWRREKGIHD